MREVLRGSPYLHVSYRPRQDGAGVPPAGRPEERAAETSSPGPLHVYLGGDGSPRGAARWRPPDPTPAEPVALRLMALDPAPRIYLGRPCYHGTEPCEPWIWTRGRYSEAVVASMAAALEAARRPGQPLVLIGHSGGGTLAMLLAARLSGVRAVVTLAGNLDVAAWTRLHGFEPFQGLDPAREPRLPPGIVQLHVVGAGDRVVPPDLVLAAAARQGARARVLAGVGHDGPFEPSWPGLLAELAAALEAARPAQNWMRPPSVTR